ncbi:MAG: O-antigen ligase family protein [Bacteroidetes bacterium]|nr:O-antigen ligase family protein [Bacteroidota bacterium]
MYYIIAFSLLYSLKGITSANLVLYFLPDFILLVGIFRYAFVNEVKLYLRKVEKSSNFYPYLGLMVLVGVSIIRSSYPGSTGIDYANDLITFSLFNILTYSILSGPFKTRDYFDAIFTRGTLMVVAIPAALVGLFLVIFMVGAFESGARYQSQIENSAILGLLGIGVKAKPIPFTEGMRLSHISLLGAGVMIISYLSARYFDMVRWKKNLLYAGVGVSALVVLLSDSWGPLLSLLLTAGVLFYYLKFREAKYIRMGIWIIPLIPVVVMILLTGIFGYSFESKVNLQSDQGVSASTQRMIMWEKSTDRLLSPGMGHLIGNGQYAQLNNGVNDAFYEIVPQENVRHIESPRNTIFQVFMDTGILGTALLLYVLLLCFDNAVYLFNRGYVGGLIYISFIIFTAFASIFESAVGMYNLPYMFTLIIVLLGTIVYRNEFDRIAAEDWN